MHHQTRGLVIDRTQRGVGKTTVTLGLLAALRRRGLVMQPFKVGPDFIDPGHHRAAGVSRTYRLRSRKGGDPVAEGYTSPNVLTSYVHLHFGSDPVAAKNLVANYRSYKENLNERTEVVATC